MPRTVIPKSFLEKPYAIEKFSAITEWARENHPFYREWLEDKEKEIPLLTRYDVLKNNDALLNGKAVTATTSGSTGVPVKVSWDKNRRDIEARATEKFIHWLGGRMNATRLIHLDKPAKNSLDVKTSIAEQLALIDWRHRHQQGNAITTYPSNAERLCREVITKNIDMSYIKRFGVFAEVFEDYQEALIRQAFPSAQIWSTYSSQEFGMIAARCPHEPQFHHVMAGKLGVEILDENNQPCSPGEVGRLVITDYFNRNAPLIRYDIGDLAAWGECPCGKISLPALSVVLGKIRGALLHRNGERVPFTELSVLLRDIPGMQQYQVTQNSLEEFVVRLVHDNRALKPGLQKQVEQAFLQHFHYLPAVTIHQETIIEREANGKFYSSICKI